MDFYFDESGNLGKDGDYFVFSVFATKNPKRFKNLVKKYRKKWGKSIPLKELKGAKTSPFQKISLFNDFNKKKDFIVGYIVCRKDKINPHLLKDKNIMYNYLLSWLVQRSVKYALNQKRITLHIDEHDIKVSSKNSFEDYIKINAYTKWNYEGEIEVKYWDSARNNLIQIADIISNTVYQYYEKKKNLAFNRLKFKWQIKFPIKKFK